MRAFLSNLWRASFDNLRLAFGTFLGNPLRSLLTLLGIVIGVTTVITMMALIEGLRIKVNKDLSQLGANTFQATKWPTGFGRINWQKYAKRPDITLEELRASLSARGHAFGYGTIRRGRDTGGFHV